MKLPYLVQPTLITKVLEKAQQAQTPERFTVDFLQTKLGCKGGNYRQFIPLAKKMGLLGSDGKPTDLYRQFRNSVTSKAAIAAGIKRAYAELFSRNEYANNLTKDALKGLVVEITGVDSTDVVVKRIIQTIETLKKHADFEAAAPIAQSAVEVQEDDPEDEVDASAPPVDLKQDKGRATRNFGLGLSYTINLVLPRTEDPAVFNAIFRSLKEHLLKG